MALETIAFDGRLRLLDQRLLPEQERWIELPDVPSAVDAIASMAVRGAPAIGVVAGYALALAAARGEDVAAASAALGASRPTAVNLRWALERVGRAVQAGRDPVQEAIRLHADDVAANRAMGAFGAPLLAGGVLTICNTGALATGGHGTALGVVRSAIEAGQRIHLYALETRPKNQGARLTAWECSKDGIPCTLLADSMAAALLAAGRVDAVVVGCDRVAANGDTANKIGTYALAVLARHHGLPFYVAMPLSTLDRRCPDGASIPIEERDPGELWAGLPGVGTWNPAFDVTPAALITAWITEEGVWRVLPPDGAP